MDQRLRDYYTDSRVNNATPGELLIMLYDYLAEHAEKAEQEISALTRDADIRPAAREVTRCINALTELNTCLRHSVEPTLCRTLRDLYLFFMRHFSEALETRKAEKIREVLPLIRNLRDTWAEADRRAHKYQPGSIAVAA